MAKEVNEGLGRILHWRRRLLATKQGEVLLIEWRYGQWIYHISGPGRTGAGSCMGWDTIEQCEAAAKSHAESAYGGVAWECTL